MTTRGSADGDIVLLDGATTAAENGTPGHPDLPIVKLRYVLPPGMRVASVWVISDN